MTSGFTTNGKCVSTIPPKCQATGTSDGKGPDAGLSKLGELLGKLMEAMKGGGGGGGSGSGSGSTDPNSCTTMQPTGDKALSQSNSTCYFYDKNLDTTVTSATDPTGGLVATPTEGPVPLKVTFAFTNGTTACPTSLLLIDYGDGNTEQLPTHTSTVCSGTSETTAHTYTLIGLYAARIKNAQTSEVRGGVNLNVTAATATDTPRPDTPTPLTHSNCLNAPDCASGNTTGGTTNTHDAIFTNGNATNISGSRFNTPLTNLNDNGSVSNNGTGGSNTSGGSASTGGSNSTGASLNFNTPQSIVQSIIQKNVPAGAYGDVKILANGTTIIAGVRDGNSGVAGFYGTNSTTGKSQGAIARMCINRPWSKNFLSFIIPSTFFDSLCTLRGYTVGQKPPSAIAPTATITTFRPTTVKTTIGGTKPPVTATSAPATIQNTAKVDIWASPPSVPLGARTSIFWNTQGVKDCIETSPDGSFTHTSLKGGASTVPLTQSTTFTISCVAPNGAHLTDNVTVQMAL